MDFLRGESAFCKMVNTADDEFDGHLTVMKFTTGWKVMFGTPNFGVLDKARVRLSDLPDGMSLAQAIEVANTLKRSL